MGQPFGFWDGLLATAQPVGRATLRHEPIPGPPDAQRAGGRRERPRQASPRERVARLRPAHAGASEARDPPGAGAGAGSGAGAGAADATQATLPEPPTVTRHTAQADEAAPGPAGRPQPPMVPPDLGGGRASRRRPAGLPGRYQGSG